VSAAVIRLDISIAPRTLERHLVRKPAQVRLCS
jgi:hypothetical protein